MALEVEMVGPRAVAAVEHIVEAGRLGALLEALQQVPDDRGAARAVWDRVATSDVVRRLVRADPPDFTVLDRLIPHVGYAAAEPLLDALAVAQSRGARRGLLAQLVRLGAGIGPLVVRRLEDDRWYVIRNLLALLEDLAVLPEGFSPARFALHADARVRRQAVKLQLKLPDERDVALVTALKDQDPRTVRLALGLIVALHSCPAAAVSLLVSRASDRVIAADLRVLAIRALGASSAVGPTRSEEHTSELQSLAYLVCRLLLEKK